MNLTPLKITMIAFVMIGTISCKNSEKENEMEMEAAAEASEMAFDYKVDSAASEIKWEGSKPTATHHGIVKLSSGVLSIHEGEIQAGNFVIDMNSITDEDLTGDDKANLEAHLKGTAKGKEGDFFDVQKYPTALFELIGVENNRVKGNLTIKGKTNTIEFPATVVFDGDKMTFTSEPFELDRTKWSVNFGSKSIFPSLGDKFISDTMKLTVSLEAKKV